MRSARVALLTTALLLVALPLGLLAAASLYERWLFGRYEEHLARVAAAVVEAPELDLAALGRREQVELERLDARGEVVARSDTGEAALAVSALGGAAEQVVARLGASGPRESFAELVRDLGPARDRPEVQRALQGTASHGLHSSRSGETVLFSLAAPLPGGGAIDVLKASHRGVRRLVLLRGELLKLIAYQAVLALLAVGLLARWLVRPLEQLAQGARAFTGNDLAGPALLRRRDEIGQLAREINALATSLDQRRRATVDLAADLAHELKNPLATIAASAELIASTQAPTAERRQLVQGAISEAVERLRATCDELLGLVRLEASLVDAPREPVDCAALVERVVDGYRQDPRWQGHTLRTTVAPDVGTLSLVPRAWERLLRNLIDNALVHAGERREVEVSVRRAGGEVVTEVRDHGPGISAGNRDKVFRRFFTNRPAGAPPGTGLGLSIVQTVAEAHGGTVELDSEPGQGATFRVRIPA